MHVHLARTLGAFEPSDKIDHQDETAALEVAHVTLGPKSQRKLHYVQHMGSSPKSQGGVSSVPLRVGFQ